MVVLIVCAHPDDEVFGAGGTIAKYAKQGIDVHAVIFSYGENSHPWLRKEITSEIRIKESSEIDKALGCTETKFLSIPESEITKKAKSKEVVEVLKRTIWELKPDKIFTHSINDPHPGHRAVYNSVLKAIDELGYDCHVYSFDIWNPIMFFKREEPKLFVDISDTFNLKLKALKKFKSQKMSLFALLPSVYTKARLYGAHAKTKYAEMFYKVR